MRANLIGAAHIGLFAALAVTPQAHALSCVFPQDRYFFDCESGVCSPLFHARVHFTFEPCGARWVLEGIDGDTAALLLNELAGRGTQASGVLEVSVNECGLRTSGIADWPDYQDHMLGKAKVKVVQASPEEIREEWEAKESDGYWRAFRRWLPAWLWAAALFVVLLATARRLWSDGLRRRNSRRGVISFLIGLQVLIGFVGYVAIVYGRHSYSSFAVPIALLAPAAIGVVAIELLMLAAKRSRARA